MGVGPGPDPRQFVRWGGGLSISGLSGFGEGNAAPQAPSALGTRWGPGMAIFKGDLPAGAGGQTNPRGPERGVTCCACLIPCSEKGIHRNLQGSRRQVENHFHGNHG